MKELADLTAPAVITKKPLLEAEIQKQCVDWARARGYWARKFSSLSQRSVPDYLFAKSVTSTKLSRIFDDPVNIKFFTEFKREGCKLDKVTGLMSTKAQVDEQEAMRTRGWFGFECNDFLHFKQTVLGYERECLC